MTQQDRRARIAFERKKTREADMGFDFQEASEFMDRMPGPTGPERNQENDIHPLLQKNADSLEGEWCYPEWDVELQDNKPNFTKVMELSPLSSGSDFVRDVQHRYHAEIQEIKNKVEKSSRKGREQTLVKAFEEFITKL